MNIHFYEATSSHHSVDALVTVTNGIYVPKIGETITIHHQKYLVNEIKYHITRTLIENVDQKGWLEELHIYMEEI